MTERMTERGGDEIRVCQAKERRADKLKEEYERGLSATVAAERRRAKEKERNKGS